MNPFASPFDNLTLKSQHKNTMLPMAIATAATEDIKPRRPKGSLVAEAELGVGEFTST